MANLIQPKGSVSKETTKRSIALCTDATIDEVDFLSIGLSIDDLIYVYEPETETIWYTSSSQKGTVTSWSISDNVLTLMTTTNTYNINRVFLNIAGDLPKSYGLSVIGQCSNLDELRSITLSNIGDQIFLKEHTTGQNAGGGIWYLHSLTSSNYTDDNGCQIITSSGQVFRRKDLTQLTSDLFGLIPGGNIDTVLNNMFIASRTFNIEDAYICYQGYGNLSYRSNGGLSFDLSDGKGFYIRGLTSGTYGPTILHAGDNICMRLYKNGTSAKEFWISGGFFNLRIIGRDSTFTTNNSNTTATALEVSDMWGAQFKNLFIGGYVGNSQGSAISIYNDTSWTEGTVFSEVIIRTTMNGLWFHRNTTSGSTATDSFFNTRGDVSINADVSGQAINYVKIGDGTSSGACFMYGHDLRITGWMGKGSWHNGIYITNYSTCVNGKIQLNWDGYGISSSATAEVIHLLRLGGSNAKLDCNVFNTSGQSNGYPISMVQVIANTCMYLQDSNLFNGTIAKAAPILRPKGLTMKFKGTFSLAECQAGLSYQLTNLLPGMNLRVRLWSWNDNSQYQTNLQEWDVYVRGTDFPCIVKPALALGTTISTTTGSALTTTAGATDTFVKTATITTSQVQQNGQYGNTLTITNGQTNNAVSYLANSGRKINFVLPANASATVAMPYEVEIEIM